MKMMFSNDDNDTWKLYFFYFTPV